MNPGIAAAKTVKKRAEQGAPSRAALLAPAFILYGFVFLLPFLLLAAGSLQVNEPQSYVWERSFTPAGYARLFGDAHTIAAIMRTLIMGVIVVAVSIVVGYLLAWHIYRANSFAKTTLITAVLTPLFSGALLQSLGWYLMFARYGPINRALMDTGLLSGPLNILGTRTAIVIALVHAFLPFMVLSIVNSLRSMPENLLHAAQSLGASNWTAFVKVTLPLTKGGIFTGSALVFGGVVGSFATPGIIGQGKIQLMAQIVYQQAVQVFDWSYASVISVALLALLAVLSFIGTQIASRLGRRDAA